MRLMQMFILALAFGSGIAQAGTATGVIGWVYFTNTSPATATVVLKTSPAPTYTSVPTCVTSSNSSPPLLSFSITASTDAIASANNRAMFAQLVSAQAVGATVTLYGNGACSTYGDRETVFQVLVQSP